MLKCGILEEFWPLEMEDFCGSSEVRALVEDYAGNLGNARKNGISVFLHGTNGTGKTMLGVCILKKALRSGYTVQCASLGGIIQAFTEGWYDDDKRRRYEETVRDVDFLMIDDVGKEYRNRVGLTEVVFDNLIRYRTFRKKPMVLTTNSTIEAIESSYGKSLVSLLMGRFIPIAVVGPDYRKEVLSQTVRHRLIEGD